MTKLRVCVALVAMFVLAAPVAAQDAAKRAEKAFKEAQKRAKKESYRDAVERYREAAAAYKEAGDAVGQIQSLLGAGRMLHYFGEAPADAAALFLQAHDVAQSAGNHELEAEALKHAGRAYAAAGDGARAAEYRARAAEIRKQYGLPEPFERVSGGVLAGKARIKVQPRYPFAAREAKVEGVVVVEVMVSTAGVVEAAHVVSGPPELRDAALEAAQQWTFAPTTLSGEPVRIQGTITFNFRRS
jgi:TonB family protein